jgi:fumarylacetoacetate (FAA) hydrolase
MKLGSLRSGGRDGTLVVANEAGDRFEPAPVTNLQAALDDWPLWQPALASLSASVDRHPHAGVPLDLRAFVAPLPRAYEWLDGSAFLSHVRLARQARGAEMPPDLLQDPLVYQGGSGVLTGPRDDLVCLDPALGLDFEAEIAVIVGDVPLGTSAADALAAIRLVCLINDVTLRNLVPKELAKGFGFVQSKPATAFAPFALTQDSLGAAFHDGRLHLRVLSRLNGTLMGDCDAGEMHFGFGELIAHVARTRALTAGTIIGSGTVSNQDPSRGVSCLVERRMRETLESGSPRTAYLQPGDTIEIDVQEPSGRSVFGSIVQKVIAP